MTQDLIIEHVKTCHKTATQDHMRDFRRKHEMQLLRQIHKQKFRKFTVEFFHRLEETDNSKFIRLKTTAIVSDYK